VVDLQSIFAGRAARAPNHCRLWPPASPCFAPIKSPCFERKTHRQNKEKLTADTTLSVLL
jgi:hypothetical protein